MNGLENLLEAVRMRLLHLEAVDAPVDQCLSS